MKRMNISVIQEKRLGKLTAAHVKIFKFITSRSKNKNNFRTKIVILLRKLENP